MRGEKNWKVIKIRIKIKMYLESSITGGWVGQNHTESCFNLEIHTEKWTAPYTERKSQVSYTLPQKKRNFSEFAFLLGRSVGQWNLGQMIFFDGGFCLLLPGAFPLVDMTRGHWPLSRVTIENPENKVAFLLGKSVVQQWIYSIASMTLTHEIRRNKCVRQHFLSSEEKKG